MQLSGQSFTILIRDHFMESSLYWKSNQVINVTCLCENYFIHEKKNTSHVRLNTPSYLFEETHSMLRNNLKITITDLTSLYIMFCEQQPCEQIFSNFSLARDICTDYLYLLLSEVKNCDVSYRTHFFHEHHELKWKKTRCHN